jgi:hypothetical protein
MSNSSERFSERGRTALDDRVALRSLRLPLLCLASLEGSLAAAFAERLIRRHCRRKRRRVGTRRGRVGSRVLRGFVGKHFVRLLATTAQRRSVGHRLSVMVNILAASHLLPARLWRSARLLLLLLCAHLQCPLLSVALAQFSLILRSDSNARRAPLRLPPAHEPHHSTRPTSAVSRGQATT